MLALHGFDAFGLEVSQKAVDTANEYAERQLSQPSAYNFSENHSRTQDGARGNVKFICGDFFQRDWEEQCQSEGERGFDIIYDYTVSVSVTLEYELGAYYTLPVLMRSPTRDA